MNKRVTANVYIIISIILGYLLSAMVSKSYLSDAKWVIMLNILNVVVITLIPTLICTFCDKNTLFQKFKKVSVTQCAKYIFTLPFIWMSATYLNGVTNNLLSDYGIVMIEQLPQTKNPDAILIGFIFACVIAPIFEEIFYRGVILSLLKGYGNCGAIVISAALFALGHNSITVLVSPFVMGLFLGYVTLCSGSIFPAILLHFESNLISWLLTNCQLGRTANIIINVTILIVGAATTIFVILKNRVKFKKIFSEVGQYIKNPLWIPILANYIYINIIEHG